VPAALAVAERRRSSGAALLDAFLVAFEVVHRLGREMGIAALSRGFHPTGLWAPIGAAVAASRLLGLSADATVAALGIAGSQAAGIMANTGTMTKPFHAGWGAHAGVSAGLLAGAGFEASREVVEGDRGLLRVFGDGSHDLDRVVAGLGAEHFPLQGYALKLYPACGKTHCAIDAALHLRRAHGVGPDDVAAVEVEAAGSVTDVLVHHEPTTPLEAKFSMEYCVAVALADGAAGLRQFTAERVADPALAALAGKVKIVPRPAFREWDGFLEPERVTVVLRDGRSVSHQVGRPAGALGSEVGKADVIAKFEECAAAVLPSSTARRAMELCLELPDLSDVRALTSALSGSGRDDRSQPLRH
jgi:2-methylcitrate dehydratase PrpD